MKRREMLQEGVKSLGQALPLVLGTLAGLGGVLKTAGDAFQPETPKLKPKRKKMLVRRKPE